MTTRVCETVEVRCINCGWRGQLLAIAICPDCDSRQIRRVENGDGRVPECVRDTMGERASVTFPTPISASIALVIVGDEAKWEWTANVHDGEHCAPRTVAHSISSTVSAAKDCVVGAIADVIGGEFEIRWSGMDDTNTMRASGGLRR